MTKNNIYCLNSNIQATPEFEELCEKLRYKTRDTKDVDFRLYRYRKNKPFVSADELIAAVLCAQGSYMLLQRRLEYFLDFTPGRHYLNNYNDKPKMKKAMPMLESMLRALTYSNGSVKYGSFHETMQTRYEESYAIPTFDWWFEDDGKPVGYDGTDLHKLFEACLEKDIKDGNAWAPFIVKMPDGTFYVPDFDNHMAADYPCDYRESCKDYGHNLLYQIEYMLNDVFTGNPNYDIPDRPYAHDNKDAVDVIELIADARCTFNGWFGNRTRYYLYEKFCMNDSRYIENAYEDPLSADELEYLHYCLYRQKILEKYNAGQYSKRSFSLKSHD